MSALIRCLARDRRGAVFALGAFAILLTGAMSMFAADLARHQLARSRLQTAADAAALAAARDLGRPEETLRAIAVSVFDANLRATVGDLDVAPLRIAFAGGATPETSDTIRITASATLPLLSNVAALALDWREGGASDGDPLRFAPLNLEVAASARKRVMGAEIMMVLDNTGSMNGQPIQDLRTAAQTLAEAVFAGRESVPNVWMGLVNYAATVNIGRQHDAWLDSPLGLVDAAFAPTRWKGCVRVRAPGLAEGDDPPDVARFSAQLWPSSRLTETPQTFDAYIAGNPKHRNIWAPAARRDDYTVIDAGLPAVDERQSARNDGYGPNLGCPAPITPLVSSRSAILDAINGANGVPGIEAWHRGGTFGNIGLVWGWRSLSPRWRGLWRRPDGTANPTLPVDYDTPFHNKIIVMMTDGANGWYQSDMTTYGRPGEIPIPGGVNESMKRLCQRIKDEGIVLFTITFGSGGATARPTYEPCASPATLQRMPGPKYFHAPSGAELVTVFGNIAGQISELRLVP